MDFLPTDWGSFVWGVAIGASGAFFAGFMKKFGEDVYRSLKSKWFPGPPEPVKVDGKFVATAFEPAKCAWISEGKTMTTKLKTTFTIRIRRLRGNVFA